MASPDPVHGGCASAYCAACGHSIPLWFTSDMTDQEDDAAYERWLDTPCSNCGAKPRAALPVRRETVH